MRALSTYFDLKLAVPLRQSPSVCTACGDIGWWKTQGNCEDVLPRESKAATRSLQPQQQFGCTFYVKETSAVQMAGLSMSVTVPWIYEGTGFTLLHCSQLTPRPAKDPKHMGELVTLQLLSFVKEFAFVVRSSALVQSEERTSPSSCALNEHSLERRTEVEVLSCRATASSQKLTTWRWSTISIRVACAAGETK